MANRKNHKLFEQAIADFIESYIHRHYDDSKAYEIRINYTDCFGSGNAHIHMVEVSKQ